MNKRPLIFVAMAVLVFAIVPVVLGLVGSAYIARLAQLALITVTLCASLNLLTGATGLLALDAAVFYGLGAYVAAIASVQFGIGFPFTLLLAMAVAVTVGVVIGFALVRLVSVFFAVATMGLAISFNTIVLNWSDVTQGPMGYRGIPTLDLFGLSLGSMGPYFVTAGYAALVLWVVHRCMHSFYGNALRAVREDEDCARAMGLSPRLLKTQAYALHACLIGGAGALYAHINQFIGPDNFVLLESALILTGIVVGGLGSWPGAIIGGLLMALLPEMLREFGHFRIMIFGLILFFAILFLPRGLFSEVRALDLARRLLPNSAWSRRQ